MHQFVGRQPIFNTQMKVVAYELLFRSGLDNYFPGVDGDLATSSVIENHLFGPCLEMLTGPAKAFINFPRRLLIEEYALLLPREEVVIEILEDIIPDDEVLNAVRRLKEEGYTLALDDFMVKDLDNPLVDLVDLIKVDFSLTSGSEQERLADQLLASKIPLLAEKIESREEYQRALDLGYSLFQGYFYCKPTILRTARIPESKAQCIRLLEAVNREKIDLNLVEEIIKTDLAFTYKLLRFINSAHFGFCREISSIREALIVLGELRLRKWASLAACALMADDKPSELLATAMVRGRFCELLAEPACLPGRGNDLFLIGMFSILDALLDLSMDSLLQEISLHHELKDALLGESNPLRTVLDMVLTFENGDWRSLEGITRTLKIPEQSLPAFYMESIKMASEMPQLGAAEPQSA
ncbi:MAG: HDOD domain-containing protein [Planctomycetes bacterium]|nr:HDOD domain-containing protein [Planctomycetota bacterium]